MSDAEIAAALRALVGALGAGSTTPANDWVDLTKLPISAKALRRAIATGELEASRVGRALLARRSEVDAWLEARRCKVTRRDESAEPSPALRLLGAKAAR